MKHGAPNNRKLKERVDLGLALARILLKPGQELTTHDIAAWCDCERQNVEQIYKRAIKRVQTKLKLEGVI